MFSLPFPSPLPLPPTARAESGPSRKRCVPMQCVAQASHSAPREQNGNARAVELGDQNLCFVHCTTWKGILGARLGAYVCSLAAGASAAVGAEGAAEGLRSAGRRRCRRCRRCTAHGTRRVAEVRSRALQPAGLQCRALRAAEGCAI